MLLNHWGANFDNFDPRIVGGLAADRPVYAINYRGIGWSDGDVALTVAEWRGTRSPRSAPWAWTRSILGFLAGRFRPRRSCTSQRGRQAPQPLDTIRQPVLVVSGENSTDMARRIPDAELVVYPDAGHGGIFQNRAAFVAKAKAFLADLREHIPRPS